MSTNGFCVEKYESNLSSEKKEMLKNLFSDISFGDAIWARRYNNDDEKENILENHQEGPFIVLGKIDDGLICIKGSGIYKDNYIIDLDSHDCTKLSKKTYFSKLVLIDDYSFITKIDSIQFDKCNELLKKLKNSRQDIIKIYDEIVKFKFSIDIGDIVLYSGKEYIVLNKIDDKYLIIEYNNKINLKYDECKSVNMEDIKFISIIPSSKLKLILNDYKEYLDKCKERDFEKFGNIVTRRDSVGYVDYQLILEDNGNKFGTVKLSINFDINKDLHLINEKKFYTDYEKYSVRKNSNFLVFYQMSKEEIDEFDKKRKKYLIIHSNDKPFKPGNIVEDNDQITYIVIAVLIDTVKCISIDDIKNGLLHIVQKRFDSIKPSRNVDLSGIKIFDDGVMFPKKINNIKDLNKVINYQIDYLNSKKLKK